MTKKAKIILSTPVKLNSNIDSQANRLRFAGEKDCSINVRARLSKEPKEAKALHFPNFVFLVDQLVFFL